MSAAIHLATAIVPALLILWYFAKRDIFPEPTSSVLQIFLLGVASILLVIPFYFPLNAVVEAVHDPYMRGLAQAFLLAAVPEELAKFLVLLLFCVWHPKFHEPMDGIVYGVAASLGFAAFENVIYVTEATDWLKVATVRSLSAVPVHAATGIFMGYLMARYTLLGRQRLDVLVAAFVVPVLVHGLYDFPIMAGDFVIAAGGRPPVWLLVMFLVVTVGAVTWALALALQVRRLQFARLVGRLGTDWDYESRISRAITQVARNGVRRGGISPDKPDR